MELHLKGFRLDRIRERCLDEVFVPSWLVPTYRRSAIEKHLKQDFYAALAKPARRKQEPVRVARRVVRSQARANLRGRRWTRLQASFGRRPAYKKIKHQGLFAQGELTLTCAAPDCGCKITYAPKEKNGKTYRYYRCADGRRVHRGQRRASGQRPGAGHARTVRLRGRRDHTHDRTRQRDREGPQRDPPRGDGAEGPLRRALQGRRSRRSRTGSSTVTTGARSTE